MSGAKDPRCSATNVRGEPCKAPSSLVDPESGLCPAHAPGGRERLREAARKGAQATARRLQGDGLAEDDLPSLRTPRDAATWLERIGRAVATGQLANRDADAATRAVRVWLQAHEQGEVRDRMEELESTVEQLKGTRGLRAVT